METKNFLFEIGVEEIPAGYIANALTKIQEYFVYKLMDNKITYDELKTYSTPRRFTVYIKGLITQQADETVEKLGPAKRVAFNEDGTLSKAGAGFLRSCSASENDYSVKETPKGEYLLVTQNINGKLTSEILKSACEDIIKKLQFPKSMRWGNLDTNFARPIRWIIALFNEEILPVQIDNISASNISYGIRYEKLSNPVRINHPDEYIEKLKQVKVYADREERKNLIQEQLKELYKNSNSTIIDDPRLLDIVTDLVEYPTAVIAEYEEKYLRLPEKIITSTLTQNQKYFAVQNADGKLSNQFVFISNGDPACSNIIKLGNQKVVRARLEDADFYYKEDLKHNLDVFVPKLDDVVFQAKLGTLLEKTERNSELVRFLCQKLNCAPEDTQDCLRAVRLAKADLVTLMLGEKEFTKLQGYMGMIYAIETGEKVEIAQAIYEHYQPRGQNDALPSTQIGAIVALADKIDTVCGIIGVNLVPTGSNDPFALRRAANGIVQIIDSHKFNLSLTEMIDKAFSLLNSKLSEPDFNKAIVYDFFKQRVVWLLQQSGIEYDVINSVMHIDFSDIADLQKRALDLQAFKKRDDFMQLVQGFKRVANILGKFNLETKINRSLFEIEAETQLFDEYNNLYPVIMSLLVNKDYRTIMEKLVSFRKHIDLFFDKVLVNTEDEKIKNNRYALLELIKQLFIEVADLSLIVTDI